MNSFNKLYNLILQSIITEDIESKIRKAIQTLIKSGQLKDQNDPRVQQVKAIIKRNNSIDINGKIRLNQLLKDNQILIKRDEAKKDNYLDKIPEFTDKQEYQNGVVIYKVDESTKGMKAVRDIIDVQWGKDANPWCLAARTGKNNDLRAAGRHWKRYNAYPKHIAFQNGKLIAFSANDQEATLWWDRQDKAHYKLPLLDGTQMRIKPYAVGDIFKEYPNLKLNEQTGRYDFKASIKITDSVLVDGHFPIPFGYIGGGFDCNNCHSLETLQNAPTKIYGNFDCGWCEELTSLVGMPQIEKGGIFITGDDKLENLKGMPKICPGAFQCYGMENLKSLEGCSEIIGSNCYISSKKLANLQGGPKVVKGDFHVNGNPELVNLKGCPREIGGKMEVYHCLNLQSLQGGPDKVKSINHIGSCPKLKITEEDKKKYVLKEKDY